MTALLDLRTLLIAALGAIAALTAAAPAAAQIGREGGPIDITADRTEFLDGEHISRWIGRVDVRQGSARLLADRMDVHFAADAGPGELGAIEKIEAVGSVRYEAGDEVARGDRGVYLASTEQIELTGNVTLVRGSSTLIGERLIVDPSVGRSTIVGARGSANTSSNRVRAVFSGEDKPPKAAPEPGSDAPEEGGSSSGGAP